MSGYFIKLLRDRCRLSERQADLLTRGPGDLTSRERREFRRHLQPRLDEFRAVLEREYLFSVQTDPSTPDRWATQVALVIMGRGYPSYVENLVIRIVGRGRVARALERLKGDERLTS